MKKFSTNTRIRIEVEMRGSSYGPEWNVGDMAKQAAEEGAQAARNAVERSGGRVIGEPKVLFTIATEE